MFMKSLLNILGVVFCIGLINISCSEEGFKTFGGEKSGIYMQSVASTDMYGTPLSYKDSIVFSFSSYKEDVVQYTLSIPVLVMGEVKDYDRPFVLKVDESKSTAVRGVHFDFKEEDCIMPANEASKKVPIVLYRKADLQTQTVRIVMSLADNEYFTAELEEYKNTPSWNAVGTELCGTRYKIIFNDTYTVTNRWITFGESFFGTWSASKEKLLNEIMGWTHMDWVYSRVPYGRMGFAAKELKKYLQELADAGTPVIDEDGSYMQLQPPYEVDYSAYQ